MLYIGIDEAGRGPVLGPMVIAGVLLKKEDITQLVTLGIKDSKQISKKKRESLYHEIIKIAQDYKIIQISPAEIDANKQNNSNLNNLELENIINILSELKNWNEAYIDACDVDPNRMQKKIQNHFQGKIIAEHKADINYPVVSAASILAKVTRDNEILQAQKQYDIDLGSGYCSDQKTINFLTHYVEKYSKLPEIARKSWITSQKLMTNKNKCI